MIRDVKTPTQIHLDPLTLMDRARKETGLDDFGDPWFETPLHALVGFINEEGDLTSDSCFPVDVLMASLRDRLKLVDYLKRYPEVLDEEVDVVGVIIGLPRGGSTLLQRILCTTRQVTSTYWWELLNPLPLANEKPGDPTPRIDFAKATRDAMYAAWPGMDSMHPLEPEGYDEEVQLIERSLLCIMWPFYFHVPSYVAWMMKQDQTKAYNELRIWLQVLQHQNASRRGRKWLLKSPHHLLGGGLRHALRIFPKAKMIMTHRAIEDVITSFCSLQSAQLRPFCSSFDQTQMGRRGIAWFQAGLNEMVEVRAHESPERFIDVQYKDMMTDPMGQYRRVMSLMGLKVTFEDENDAKSWLAANGRDTHPRHKYTAEENGVTRAELVEAFKDYARRFLT